jgi:hypothetical protein
MLRKLVLLALSTGLIKKVYDTYKAERRAPAAPAPMAVKPAPMPGTGDPHI